MTRSRDAADRLVSALAGFRTETPAGDDGKYEVHVFPDAETSLRLLVLFDSLGEWCMSEDLASVALTFGERTFNLVRPTRGSTSDPTQFLLERTIQLQTALESRIVIEQAKGILAERHGITIGAAFEQLRRAARADRIKIHEHARRIVENRALTLSADGQPAQPSVSRELERVVKPPARGPGA